MTTVPYFTHFLGCEAPEFPPLSRDQSLLWHLFASATIGSGLWYLIWRWGEGLNPEALVFSTLIATCETLAYIGTLIFYFDIWSEYDRQVDPTPATFAGLADSAAVSVDIFITTYDEPIEVLEPSINAAKNLNEIEGVFSSVFLLDDGNRAEMRKLALDLNIQYMSRNGNRGFKAGNLANALFQTNGEFFVICDADTQLFPTFLENTLGYFQNPKVSWVQTPHWFYELPEGVLWKEWLQNRLGRWAICAAPIMEKLTGRNRVGQDHFLADPAIFFDLIQRRRDRHGASFCCGAGSIHRREAVMENALLEKALTLSKYALNSGSITQHKLQSRVDLQPFKFHVSEDIFTSIQAHGKGWTSVYHPQVEARMLSPWSVTAWAVQKLKYAGGTFDIFLNANPLFKKRMCWKIKLHYLATFWSYLSVFFLPVLLLAPAFSLVTGKAPIQSYSFEFFAKLLPVLVFNELALNATSKGNSHHASKIVTLGTMAIQLRAFWLVLLGRKPKFPTTPKLPDSKVSITYAFPNLCLLAALLGAAGWGLVAFSIGVETHTISFLVVNLFWIFWGVAALGRMTFAMMRNPKAPTSEGR